MQGKTLGSIDGYIYITDRTQKKKYSSIINRLLLEFIL